MSKRTRSRRAKARREFTTPDGLIAVPAGSPKIVIHTRQGRCVGIYCDQPAKVLVVETQDDPRRTAHPKTARRLPQPSPWLRMPAMSLCIVPARLTKDRRLARPILMAAAVIALSAAASTTWALIPSDALLQKLQPQGNVNDYAGVLSPAERKSLEDRLTCGRRRAPSWPS
jgi:hypothetical protein